MSLKKELDKLKFDKRLTGWHVSRGKLKKEDLDAHLKSLPDSADNVYNEEDDDLDNPGDFSDSSTTAEENNGGGLDHNSGGGFNNGQM